MGKQLAPGVLLTYLHTACTGGLPGGGATHTALGQVPACRLPSLHCEGLPAWIFHFPGISEPLRPTGQAGKLSYATSSSHYR